MSSTKPRLFSPLVFAIVLHVAILIAFLFSLQFSSENVSLPGTNVQIINAVAINSNQVNEQLAEVKAQQQAAKRAQEAAKEKAIKQQEEKQKEVAEQQEKIKQEQLKQQQLAEQKQKEVQKLLQKPAPAIKKDIPKPTVKKTYDVAAKDKPEPEKKTSDKPKPEPKQDHQTVAKKPDKPAKPKVDEAAIQKRKQELEKEMAQEIAAQDKAQEAKDLLNQDVKASDQKQMQAAQSKFEAGIIDKYKALIKSAIEQHWNIPDGASKDLTCNLAITLAPGGAVLNVQIVKSSGMPALDQSAVQAVYQASPLPIPDDPNMFSNFRQLSLTVKPETIIDG